jgi:hypothetical protein
MESRAVKNASNVCRNGSRSTGHTSVSERVGRLRTPAECDALARNATERGVPELAKAALYRKLEMLADSHHPANDVERDCLRALYAYEEILRAKHGRPQKANRTRQAIDNKGLVAAMEGFVNRSDRQAGFTKLQEVGLHNFAFEAVVLRHPTHFSDRAVQRSKERMAHFEV